jgi:hypothetical protein
MRKEGLFEPQHPWYFGRLETDELYLSLPCSNRAVFGSIQKLAVIPTSGCWFIPAFHHVDFRFHHDILRLRDRHNLITILATYPIAKRVMQKQR